MKRLRMLWWLLFGDGYDCLQNIRQMVAENDVMEHKGVIRGDHVEEFLAGKGEQSE